MPANEFYNLQGGKFSTSEQRTIPLEDFAARYDVEAARFHLLASAPETADSDWRWEEFQSTVNAGLADTIGNLVGTKDGVATVKYGNEEKKVLIPDDVPVISYEPTDRTALKAGAKVIINGQRSPDGTVTAASINIGKDGLTPPM